VTEFQLEPMRLQFYPNEDEFQEEISEIITAFQQTSMQNQNLVADRYFDAFTQSVDPIFLSLMQYIVLPYMGKFLTLIAVIFTIQNCS